MPYFPRDCVCIAAYLDDGDQFWKVSYHWELLLRMLKKAEAVNLQPESKGQIGVILTALLANRPDPVSGYVDSKAVGLPHDKTPAARVVERWETLRICKQEFKKIVDYEGLTKKHPPSKSPETAAAPTPSSRSTAAQSKPAASDRT